MLLGNLVFVAVFALLLRFGATLADLTRLPSITLYLGVGAACRASGVLSAAFCAKLMPLHQAALAVITFAAGSELELEELVANYKLVRSLTVCLTFGAVLVVSALSFLALTLVPPGGAETTMGQLVAASLLAGVIAIARSPSSAIGVVSELNADGPFTQCVLSVTMVTDVVVVVLFTAAVEIVDAALTPTHTAHAAHADLLHQHPIELDMAEDHAPLAVAFRFSSRTAVHLGLSLGLGAALALACAAVLRLPSRGGPARLIRPLGITAVGALAFEAETALHVLLRGSSLDELIRLEPMLACIGAGFALCNWGDAGSRQRADRRRAFQRLLHGCMPPVLCFFFLTAGGAMDFEALVRSWPVACTLFFARLLSIRLGCAAGAAWGGSESAAAVRSRYAWLAYLTQAGVGLGLAEEVGDKFGAWGESLRSSLIASVVLNQLVGPPLLKHALRKAGEAGCGLRDASTKPDRLAESLTRQITDPTSLSAVLAAAASAAAAFPTAVQEVVVDAAGGLTDQIVGNGGRVFPGGTAPTAEG